MASINQWVSVLKPSVKAGTATVVLASTNADPEIEISASATIPLNSSPTSIAKLMVQALNAEFELVERNYTGIPSFEDTNPPSFKLRARQVGHLVDVWSQAEFSIRSVTTPEGSLIHFGAAPVYATFDDMERFGVAVGANFQTASGECLSDQQRLGALIAGSGELLMASDGFFMVAAQYLHEETRNHFSGWNFEHYPIVAFDRPAFRGDNGAYFEYGGGFQVTTSDGTVKMLLMGSPITQRSSRVKYDLKHSFVAGLAHVHETLKIETVRFASISMWPAHISKVKRGSGAIEMANLDQVRGDLRTKLARLLG